MAEAYNICSMDDCDFSTTDFSDIKCGKCAAELVEHCPECNNYINQATNIYCTKCGHPLKKERKSVYEERGMRTLL